MRNIVTVIAVTALLSAAIYGVVIYTDSSDNAVITDNNAGTVIVTDVVAEDAKEVAYNDAKVWYYTKILIPRMIEGYTAAEKAAAFANTAPGATNTLVKTPQELGSKFPYGYHVALLTDMVSADIAE